MKQYGGPAFPFDQNYQMPNDPFKHSGMSLRDYFAAKAMQGDFACQTRETGFINFDDHAGLLLGAENYYKMADAMLEARNK